MGTEEAPRVTARFAELSASVPDVDPNIAAAWITGGVGALGIAGAVVTAIVGSRNTGRATEATIAAGAATTTATLAAAREDRLWERRCAVYEETLTGLLHRQANGREDLRMYRWDEVTERQVKDFVAGYEAPGFFEANSRLLAYGSDVVIDASNASAYTHAEVRRLYGQYRMMADDSKQAAEAGNPWAAADAETMTKARREVNLGLEAAETQDQALIKVIRNELRSKPEAATLPAALPTRRRMVWHRRQHPKSATVPPLR
jgi:hypothetical protein